MLLSTIVALHIFSCQKDIFESLTIDVESKFFTAPNNANPILKKQHFLMANNWVNTIAHTLSSFSIGPRQTAVMRDSIYRSLRWGGLESTDIFNAQPGKCDILAINVIARDRNVNLPFTPTTPQNSTPCTNTYILTSSSLNLRGVCD